MLTEPVTRPQNGRRRTSFLDHFTQYRGEHTLMGSFS
ncbi:hypothetical protein IFM46972_02536 [Aspergillus udagawae]|uniref:Uncharacterized protein n=1 Tax=Aspergillus udagawae TaxID=91492 RepID=A0A8H3NGB3_9EURO|nr:hypothetical protein IFM46972_02536 [Aspergillus udagawae]